MNVVAKNWIKKIHCCSHITWGRVGHVYPGVSCGWALSQARSNFFSRELPRPAPGLGCKWRKDS